jgi:hypothetical protein
MGNKSMSVLLVIPVLVYCALFVSSSQASDFYTDAGLTANIIKIDQTTFRPVTVRAKVGYVIAPRYAVETHIATNVYRDEKEDQRYEVRNLAGLFLRYGSPVHRKFRAYLAAGYSYVTFDITDASGNYFKDRKGFSYAIGLEENLDIFKNISFTLEYAGYLDDDEDKFTMSGISAGFRASIF